MRLKGRVVADPVLPEVFEINHGDGVYELVVGKPEKEIQCFTWEREKPKKNDRWIYHSIATASVAGCTAIILIAVIPLSVSIPVILASLGWLGIVGYANR